MKVQRLLTLVLVLLSITMFSCKKDGASTTDDPSNPVIPNEEPSGILPGLFSVSASKHVNFSKGNLQYQASTGKWRFADNQWDCIGDDNLNISYNYSGWIDLFGWGTGDNPTNNSAGLGDYGNFSDWGNNTISNISTNSNKWYTLTATEWEYVMEKRATPSGIRYVCAKVNGINGYILLPDDWHAYYYHLNTEYDYSCNQIDLSDWDVLESKGAVFLPASGFRNPYDNELKYVGTKGYYWASSYSGLQTAWCLEFTPYEYIEHSYYRRNGMSVRLVCNAD